MILEIKGRKLIVTDMFIVTPRRNAILRYNVFDENYEHLTTIDANDYDDFINILTMCLTLNKF